MMAGTKKRWRVSRQYYLDAEEPENCIRGPWEVVGETWAVSEAKAINNVRFRTCGNVSQYLPRNVSGHWENGYDWKAEVIT